jgi:hypothetical protein
MYSGSDERDREAIALRRQLERGHRHARRVAHHVRRGACGAIIGIVRIVEMDAELFDVRRRARALDAVDERPEPDDGELGRRDHYR